MVSGNTTQYIGRSIMLKQVAKKLFLKCGYRVINEKKFLKNHIINFGAFSRYFNEGDDYLTLFARAREITKTDPDILKELRFYIVYQMVLHVVQQYNISGDFAECGCLKGHSTYMISELLERYDFKNQFYVFDAFEDGFPDKTQEDMDELGVSDPIEVLKEKEYHVSSYSDAVQVLKKFPFVTLCKGWIPSIFEEKKEHLDGRQYAFLHIDVDLYEPARDSLAYFYPRMVKGGVIVIDDYGYSGFPGAKKAVDEFLKDKKVTLQLENHAGGYLIIV